ncbi:MAG: hypothetical protein JRJ11_10640 [Deltaproteobacteria bacterium]|nr:hypothetical protein [Deltaproteobacteria bacterium]MBW1728727.1 hypothetical protein [Deltaproteobacteria bacterium]MBW1909984.1 hypothetical protein [Deltaproteobacteria bacterium]MBW2033437.1 hypothetical protein [Deltaproteobacteria bacterium]MBW2169441.1 hypothetical protein [Deltaproteobacteria bacterium]
MRPTKSEIREPGIAQIERDKCLQKINQVKKELAPFEKRFKMSSEKAWIEFQNGKLGDDGDVMEWMMLYENLLEFEEHYYRIKK